MTKKKVHFRVDIELGNDAMKTDADVSRALAFVATQIGLLAANGGERKVRDANGNTVGTYGFYLE